MTNNFGTMKKVNKTLIGTLIMITFAMSASAQSWNWGDQVDLAKEKNVIYGDALKAKNYTAALEPLNWLLTNTPDLNPSIYINGVKIYDALAKQETDVAKKNEYIQTAIDLHDKRIANFGDKNGGILERQALFAYGYFKSDKAKYPYLYDLFSKAFEKRGDKMMRGNLVAYMNVVYKHNFAGGNLGDELIIETYSAISEALASQRKKADDAGKKKIDKSTDSVDKLLTATKVEISCEFVETKLGPKLDENQDPTMARKVFGLLLKGKCLDSPYALKSAQIVQNDEPTYGIAKFMASKNASEGNDAEAIKFYTEAAGLTEDNIEKAEMYVSIAKIQSRNKEKSSARNSSRRALSYDPSNKDSYKLIGDLYMTSFEACAGGESKVDDRAVFIAAYNEYRKAGNSAGMANAKAQFPSIEEIFSEGKEEGQSITIGCWINTTVTLERRPAN